MIAGRLALFLAAALLVCACQRKVEQPTPDDLQAARQAATGMEVRFRSEILKRLEREDPVAVYMSYRDRAPVFAREASQKAGFDVRRIGLRVRNAANIADAWEAEQMEKFNALVEAGYDINALEASAIVMEGKNKYMRWIKPVGMEEDCMVCHGDAVPPAILKQIKQDYPLDEATGYYEFEMRGAYSVRKWLSGPDPPPSPGKYTPTPVAPSPTPTETLMPEPLATPTLAPDF